MRRLWVFSAHIAVVMLVAGLLVRLTVRDRYDGISIIYYATPWPLLAFAGAVCAVFWRARRRLRCTLVAVVLVCAAAWVWTSFHFAAGDAGSAEFRVTYWNVARPGWRIAGVLDRATAWRADLLGFGESKAGGPLQAQWAQRLAPKVVTELHRQMTLVAAEPAELIEGGSLGKAGEYELRRVALGGRRVLVLAVDFDGDFRQSRRPAFERLYQLVQAHAEEPLIVMGDFNTPIDSVHFERLRGLARDAFETAGSGYAATWPMVAPLLSLDHIWVSRHFRIVRCEHHTSLYSDHRAVVVDLAWER